MMNPIKKVCTFGVLILAASFWSCSTDSDVVTVGEDEYNGIHLVDDSILGDNNGSADDEDENGEEAKSSSSKKSEKVASSSSKQKEAKSSSSGKTKAAGIQLQGLRQEGIEFQQAELQFQCQGFQFFQKRRN